MTYELHPLCTLFPRLSGAEFDALREDIKLNGLRQPIVLHEGMILDGGNRYRACLDAGVEPIFEQFDGGNLVSFVLSANLHRRHMSPGQQAAIVASAQDWAKAQGVGKPKSVNVDQLATVDQRAAQSGASRSTQKMADKLAKADPELIKQVAHGEVSLPKAVQQVSPKPSRKPTCTIESRPADIPPEDHADELAEARFTITELSEEVEELRDRLAVEAMDATDDEKFQALTTIKELRAQVKTLEAELEAVKSMRDQYMTESAEKSKQIAYWRKEAKKVAA